jgi:hypothetical protein
MRACKPKLARVQRNDVRPSSYLQAALVSSRDEVKRGAVAPQPMQLHSLHDPHGMQHVKDVPASAGGDVHVSVRKCIKELVSQTCFEDADFERSHLSLLASMVRTYIVYTIGIHGIYL